MNTETKAEIVIFGGVAAFLSYLWLGHRAVSAGQSDPSDVLGLDLPTADAGAAAPAVGTAGSSVAAVPGITLQSAPPATFNIQAPNLTMTGATTPCGCGCGPPATNVQYSNTETMVQAAYPENPPTLAPLVYAASPYVAPTPQDMTVQNWVNAANRSTGLTSPLNDGWE